MGRDMRSSLSHSYAGSSSSCSCSPVKRGYHRVPDVMGFVNSRLYRALDAFGSLFLLNLLWLALCVPLVTAFPATAAMFAVVRDWTRDDGNYSLGRFFHHLRANFVQSLGIGILWVVLGG